MTVTEWGNMHETVIHL